MIPRWMGGGGGDNISPGFLQQFIQEALLYTGLRILNSLNYAKVVYLLELSLFLFKFFLYNTTMR